MPPDAATRLICPLTASAVENMRRDMELAFAAGATAVECRLDYLASPPTDEQIKWLLAGRAAETIVTCRPVREGGKFAGDESRRLAILRKAAEMAPLAVDVEADVPRDQWPSGTVILSHHDLGGVPANLDAIARRLDNSPAAINKIAFTAAGPEDALRAFDVLRVCSKPTIALAMGEAGVMSRILARKFVAWGTFASLAPGTESAPGQPTIAEFRDLYRWDTIGEDTSVYGVIGCPVAHSMSPAIHNAAFAAIGVDAVYVPLLIQPGADNFNRFMDALLARPWMDLRGLSVTIPHKENALAFVGPATCEQHAREIGAVNTITISAEGKLRGDNTDYAAAIDALCSAMGIARDGLAGRKVAVLGAGGAARSIVAALAHYGADVTIYNRTVARGERLAEEFSCRAEPLDTVGESDAEIIINCTPIGMHPKIDASPLAAIPPAAKVVFDTIYNPVRTRLLQQAAAAGCLTVTGLEMFVNQAVSQFEIWTGKPAPREVMRKVVVERLGAF
ncbi:MAG: shikimate dehydrogenase [Phycisphaerae bacterium]